MTMQDEKTPLGTVAARQGTKQHMNVRVLVTSLILIVLIFAGFYILFVDQAPRVTNAPPASSSDQTAPAVPPEAPNPATP